MNSEYSSGMEPGKIFVGGLSWETNKESLKNYFQKFGEVNDCVIMVDNISKKPRGFGFVTFVDQDSVAKVLSSGPHILDTKAVDPKPATMKVSSDVQGPGLPARIKKIFIGGLAAGTTEDDVRQYFEQYGTVIDVDLKVDKATNRMRGFGFVGFDSEEVVEKVVQTHFHQINGKTVEAKKAQPRNASTPSYNKPASFAPYPTASYGNGGRTYQGNAYGAYGQYPSSVAAATAAYGQQQGYGYSYPYYNHHGGYGGNSYTGGAERYGGGQQATGAVPTQQMGYNSQESTSYVAPNQTRRGYSGNEHAYSHQSGYSYDNQATAAAYQQQSYETQSSSFNNGIAQQQQRPFYQL